MANFRYPVEPRVEMLCREGAKVPKRKAHVLVNPFRRLRAECIRLRLFRSRRSIIGNSRRLKHIGPVQTNLVEIPFLQIGEFILEKPLGEGSFGVVFLGRSLAVDEVAIKMLKKSKMKRRSGKKAVDLEIGLLKHHSHHPNIIGFHGMMHTNENIYIVMEKATMSLWQLIHEKGVVLVDQPDVHQQVIIGILEALNHLHERGVAHRDIKPENVLIQMVPGTTREVTSACIRVCDFGLAVVSPKYDPNTAVNGEQSILSKRRSGTHGFVAPEMVRKSVYDACKSDIWAVGKTLMEMACSEDACDDWDDCYEFVRSDPAFFEFALESHLEEMMNFVLQDGEEYSIRACTFMLRLLKMDANQRPSAGEALQDPWFEFHVDC